MLNKPYCLILLLFISCTRNNKINIESILEEENAYINDISNTDEEKIMTEDELRELFNESTNPAAERSGYGCFGKVFDSGYIPSVPPQASPAQAGSWVCTLRKQSRRMEEIDYTKSKILLQKYFHEQMKLNVSRAERVEVNEKTKIKTGLFAIPDTDIGNYIKGDAEIMYQTGNKKIVSKIKAVGHELLYDDKIYANYAGYDYTLTLIDDAEKRLDLNYDGRLLFILFHVKEKNGDHPTCNFLKYTYYFDSIQKTKLFEDELSDSFSEQFDIDNGELVIYPPDDLLGGDTVYEIYGKGFHDSIDEKVLKHVNKFEFMYEIDNTRNSILFDAKEDVEIIQKFFDIFIEK
jgi:hypothetical protein